MFTSHARSSPGYTFAVGSALGYSGPGSPPVTAFYRLHWLHATFISAAAVRAFSARTPFCLPASTATATTLLHTRPARRTHGRHLYTTTRTAVWITLCLPAALHHDVDLDSRVPRLDLRYAAIHLHTRTVSRSAFYTPPPAITRVHTAPRSYATILPTHHRATHSYGYTYPFPTTPAWLPRLHTTDSIYLHTTTHRHGPHRTTTTATTASPLPPRYTHRFLPTTTYGSLHVYDLPFIFTPTRLHAHTAFYRLRSTTHSARTPHWIYTRWFTRTRCLFPVRCRFVCVITLHFLYLRLCWLVTFVFVYLRTTRTVLHRGSSHLALRHTLYWVAILVLVPPAGFTRLRYVSFVGAHLTYTHAYTFTFVTVTYTTISTVYVTGIYHLRRRLHHRTFTLHAHSLFTRYVYHGYAYVCYVLYVTYWIPARCLRSLPIYVTVPRTTLPLLFTSFYTRAHVVRTVLVRCRFAILLPRYVRFTLRVVAFVPSLVGARCSTVGFYGAYLFGDRYSIPSHLLIPHLRSRF